MVHRSQSSASIGTAARDERVLRVEGLRAYYRMRYFGVEREVRAVDGVDFSIAANEIYGLAGESSCGKTTLIKTIAGAVRPPLEVLAGSVGFSFGEQRFELYGAHRSDFDALRWRHLSYVMQGSMSVLNPVRRVKASFVDFAFRHIGKPKAEFMQFVSHHLDRLHLDPAVLEAYPHELSGGMRQRLSIALATVCRPEFIIADEPTTALDVVVQKSVLRLIKEIQQEMHASLLFVTHDMAVHANLADRLGIMYAGRIVEEGPTTELFREPLHPYTQHLIASLPRIGDRASKQGLAGSPPNLADPPAGCRFHPRCPLAMPRCREQVPPLAEGAAARRVACFAVAPEVS
jgi:peptide/nickel transport system ATP-binding protein